MSQNVPSRDTSLDATRTMAIWLMVACHVARLISRKIRPDWLDVAMLIEPLCQALFMSMVGMSLVYSLRIATSKGKLGWGKKQIRRAAELYLIGFLFFLAQRGWQFPFNFTSHGILVAISEAIILFMPLVLLRRGAPLAFIVTVFLGGLCWWLDVQQIQWLVLNAGNGSILPYAVLTGFGVFAAYLLLDHGKKSQLTLFGVLAVAAFVSLYFYSFDDIFSNPTGRAYAKAKFKIAANGPIQLWKLLNGQPLKDYTATYYNFRPVLVPLLMFLCTSIYAFFRLCSPLTEKLRPLWIVGRYSLGIYIFHLVVIALVVVVAGKARPFTTSWSIHGCFLGVLLMCYAYAYVRRWQQSRRKSVVVNSPAA